MRPALTVIIPAFDEASRLGQTLDALARWLVDPTSPHAEILLVDDGSRDQTARLAEAHPLNGSAMRVIRLPRNRGKGGAIKRAIVESRGEHILYMDADLSTPLAHCSDALRLLEGADLVIGVRSRDAREGNQRPLMRRLMSRGVNTLARSLVGVSASDVLCGFKAFRREAAETLFAELVSERYAFDVELLGLARHHGLRVTELPIAWRDASGSSVRPLAHSFESLAELWRIAWRLRRKNHQNQES